MILPNDLVRVRTARRYGLALRLVLMHFPELQTDAPSSKKQKLKHKYEFKEKWLRGREWLQYSSGAMTCVACKSFGGKGVWAGSGCTSIRSDAIKLHEDDAAHAAAVKLWRADLAKPEAEKEKAQILLWMDQLNKDGIAGMIKRLKLVYHLVIKNRPLSDYADQLKLQIDHMESPHLALSEALTNVQYSSHRFPEEASQCIADHVWSLQLAQLRASPFLGLMSDESTDVANVKQFIIFLWFLVNNEPVTVVGAIIPLPNGTAATMAEATLTFLDENELSLQKFTGLAMDGASVNLGANEGTRLPAALAC
jgi:hypothetical protein